MRIARARYYVCCGLFTLLIAPVLVQGQEPSRSFADLQSNQTLSQGDKIRLIDHSGTTINGRIESISENSLNLWVDGDRREFAQTEVQQLWRERPDSLWNGTLIGLGAGAAAGMLVARSSCTLPDPECLYITNLISIPAFAGVGAVVGLLIDKSTHGYDNIFSALSPSQNISMNIAPVFGNDRKGVRISFSF